MTLPSIPRWLRSPHLQTIGAAAPLFSPPRSHAALPAELVRVPIAGGHVHTKVWWADDVLAPKPIVILVHGIAGSSESHGSVRGAVAFHRAGYHVARFDMRGAGDSIPDVPSLYHAGLTTDLDRAIRHLAKDARVAGVFVLGFSGGGSITLKLAGEWDLRPPPSVLGLGTISAPLDYTRVAARMDTWSCLPYRFHVLRGLLERARLFATHHPDRAHFTLRSLERIKRFRSYDREIIVPMHGMSDVDEYYADASPGRLLAKVHVPTLVVHAEDDPMVPLDTVRPWLADASSAVTAELTAHGGHMGWLEGLDEASWVASGSVRRVRSFFDSLATRSLAASA